MKIEGKNYSDTSKFCVRAISKSVAKEMIIKNHYSHLWTKVSYSIGLFYLDEGEHQFFGFEDGVLGIKTQKFRLLSKGEIEALFRLMYPHSKGLRFWGLGV